MSPVIAPFITMGAVILLWRRAATKVMVSHRPCGTLPIDRMPRGARPRSRTMLVLTAVSSINTSRAGSNKPCARIQRRRARATSARCRSVACRLFFERDVVSIEKPPERTAAGSNPLFAQLGNDLQQGQVRLFGDQCQDLRREFLQRRNASSARLRRGTFALVPALQPLDCRTHTDIEMFGRLTARCTLLNGFDHALPQIARIAPWHRLQSWPRKSEQDDKWSFCLTAGRLWPANQERQ